MIPAAELVRLFRVALDERWGYIWGKSGQVWTQANQAASTRDMTVRYGSKWIGRKVADCSGLFVWAYKQHGEKIYHGSNTIFNKYTSATGSLVGEVDILPGTAVFLVEGGRRTHIGLYIGDGAVIEARGTKTGVVESDLSEWDEWGTLAAVDYSDMEQDIVVIDALKPLKQGDSGLTVKWLQEQLLVAGESVGEKGADGIFGRSTKAAVESFQRKNGLTVDGIVGKQTLAALTVQGEPEEVPENDEPAEDTLTIEEKVDRLWAWMMEAKGGVEDESP